MYIFIPIWKTFTNVHKHIGIRKTRNWFRYETFYYLFEFKVFRHEERETHTISFYADFSIWPHHVRPPPQTTGLASASSENRLASSKPKSQLTVFFKFQNPQLIDSGHDVIHFPGPISYLRFLLWLSQLPRARVDTCTECVHLTNPCTKPKDSQPN